ncbi:FAR1-related sequence 5-like protein [Tanacetum coccineum]
MVVIDEHHDHDMGESSMSRDPHDMGESSMHRDAQVDNQIVILPEHLQHPNDSDEFRPTPNGIPYWVPNVPEDEKPRKVVSMTILMMHLKCTRYILRRPGLTYVKAVDGEEGEIPSNRKRKRRTKSQAINCPAKLCLKKFIGTETYMVLDFMENHNHPLMNLNNMDLSKDRHQLHFDDYIFIHRASMSNLGPTRAHRLKVALVGGYHKVRGTSTDYCNFKRCVNSFIGDRDAQMLVDKMCKRKKHVPEFSFEYHTLPSKELVRLFWADETMKRNYNAFGDVVSFDATFHTNNPRRALRNDVVKMFLDSHHRLCMWHITEKLPGKVLGDLAADTKFRKDFHKMVWNVYIGPEVFEQ